MKHFFGALASNSVYKMPMTWADICEGTGLPGYPQVPGGTPAWAMREDCLARIAGGDKSIELLPDGSGIYFIFDNSDGLWNDEPEKREKTKPAIKVTNLEPERKRLPSPRLRFAVFHRDSFACVYCGKKASEEELSPDHVTPYSKGGLTTLENLVTACRPCNTGKAAKEL